MDRLPQRLDKVISFIAILVVEYDMIFPGAERSSFDSCFATSRIETASCQT